MSADSHTKELSQYCPVNPGWPPGPGDKRTKPMPKRQRPENGLIRPPPQTKSHKLQSSQTAQEILESPAPG